MFLTKKPMVKLLRRSFWTILSWVETLSVTESSWIQGGHPFGSISMGMMGKSMGKSTSISIAIVVFMGNQKISMGKAHMVLGRALFWEAHRRGLNKGVNGVKPATTGRRNVWRTLLVSQRIPRYQIIKSHSENRETMQS